MNSMLSKVNGLLEAVAPWVFLATSALEMALHRRSLHGLVGLCVALLLFILREVQALRETSSLEPLTNDEQTLVDEYNRLREEWEQANPGAKASVNFDIRFSDAAASGK